MVNSTEALPTDPTPAVVVAKAGRYYRVARYLMTLLLMGYGGWSIYDGFVSWPHWTETHPREKAKTDTDIMLNQVLGVVLPPMGLIVLGWSVVQLPWGISIGEWGSARAGASAGSAGKNPVDQSRGVGPQGDRVRGL